MRTVQTEITNKKQEKQKKQQQQKPKTSGRFKIYELKAKHDAWYDNNGFLNIDFYEGRLKVDYKKYIRKSVLDSDYTVVVKENLILREKNQPVLVYVLLSDFYEDNIVRELQKINYGIMNRSVGLVSNSRVFGFMPRVTVKRDFCTTSNLIHENPDAHNMVCGLGKHITNYYKKYCSSMFDFHSEKASKIKDDWKISGTPFSSGIINKNNSLKYHFDGGNIPNVYSNMICFKKDCEEGYLSLPEFSLALEVANKTVVFFNGQDILHGVSKFKLNSLAGYRFTIVYYTLAQMWKCEPINQEIARIRTRKHERELRRLRIMKGEEKPKDILSQIIIDDDDTLVTPQYQPYGHEKELPRKRIRNIDSTRKN